MLRIFAIIFFLIFSQSAPAHFKGHQKSYLVFFSQGASWKGSLEEKKQAEIGGHARQIKELYHQGKVLMAGYTTGHADSVVVLAASSLEEAKTWLDSNPAIQQKTLSYKIRPLKITMMHKSDHSK